MHYLPQAIFAAAVLLLILAKVLEAYLSRGPAEEFKGVNLLPPARLKAGRPPAGGAFEAGCIRVFLSVCLVAACLYVILSHAYDADSKNWAFATVGTVVGYWLR